MQDVEYIGFTKPSVFLLIQKFHPNICDKIAIKIDVVL